MPSDKELKLSQMVSAILFRSQPVPRRMPRETGKLPDKLNQARKIKAKGGWDLTGRTFLKQAEFLADYTDDFEYHGAPKVLYPTYANLNNNELRGYFSWRTRARYGELDDTAYAFVIIYACELINNIGVKDPMDGYKKLFELFKAYGPHSENIADKLSNWIIDYIVYYNLDKSLFPSRSSRERNCISVFSNIDARSQDEVIAALKDVPSKWLNRSKFYASHTVDMDAVIYKVLQKMGARYARTAKKPLVQQLFGCELRDFISLFPYAIFGDPLKRYNYRYQPNDQIVFECNNGDWSVRTVTITEQGIRRLDAILKTIDAVMREKYNYGHGIKSETRLKWVLSLINDEVDAVLAARAAPKKLVKNIDFSKLDKIRSDAAETRDKLAAPEEEYVSPPPTAAVEAAIRPVRTPEAREAAPDAETAKLSPAELRLMRCLLYGGDLAWVQAEGHILSVLVDAINESFYDDFGDSVLTDEPQLVEDYITELKEMIRP